MIRLRGSVEYLDGRLEPWEAGGAVIADWEDYATRHNLPLTPTSDTVSRFPVKRWQMFLAYTALGVAEGFDVWRATVSDVDMDGEPELVPPTPPGLSAALSSNSQS